MHKHTLKQNGVKVISAMENIPDTPEGIILESLLEGMNQYYSAELSQKVKRGLKESRIKGLFNGGPTPYGYNVKDKKVSINEEQANIVRAIENGIFNDTTNERIRELEIANKDLQEKITSREMPVIKPLDKNVIYSFLCSFKDIHLTDQLACQRLVDMFINKVILYDKYCEIYLNTNDDKSKQLKLKEQPDIDSEILFESKKKEQSYSKSSDYSLMAES